VRVSSTCHGVRSLKLPHRLIQRHGAPGDNISASLGERLLILPHERLIVTWRVAQRDDDGVSAHVEQIERFAGLLVTERLDALA